MDWNPKNWKFDWKEWKNSKECWMLLLAAGLILLILAFPDGKKEESRVIRSSQSGSLAEQTEDGAGQTGTNEAEAESGTGGPLRELAAAAAPTTTYEQQMEKRLEDILEQTEGVGKVKVMIVLRSSEEKVWHVDQDSSYSRTQETDSNGGTRNVESQDISRETVVAGTSGGSGSGTGSGQGPLLEKELRPEISGVIISASGGGSPQIQAEISGAVEALLGLPPHRIKVLKMKD